MAEHTASGDGYTPIELLHDMRKGVFSEIAALAQTVPAQLGAAVAGGCCGG